MLCFVKCSVISVNYLKNLTLQKEELVVKKNLSLRKLAVKKNLSLRNLAVKKNLSLRNLAVKKNLSVPIYNGH